MTKENWSRPDDVRDWLKSHNGDASLAKATAYVWNQVGCMMHELDDDDYWFLWEYDSWETLQNELVERLEQKKEDYREKGIGRRRTCTSPQLCQNDPLFHYGPRRR